MSEDTPTHFEDAIICFTPILIILGIITFLTVSHYSHYIHIIELSKQ